MNLIIGLVMVLGALISGFLLSGGVLAALFQPYELLVIGGCAFGAFIIANPMPVVIHTLAGIPKLLGSSPYNKQLYMELLGTLSGVLTKIRRDGLIAIEADIENPESSAIFTKYPNVLKDHHATEFMTDYLRMMVTGTLDAFVLDNLMQIELDTHAHESAELTHALNRMSDGLPAFGIVAAVLGVVITMGSLGGPIEEIGHHVAAALVGTFLGILLSYGIVGPMATAMEGRHHEAHKFLEAIKATLLASMQGYAPPVAVEFGRKVLPSEVRPSFNELDEFLRKG